MLLLCMLMMSADKSLENFVFYQKMNECMNSPDSFLTNLRQDHLQCSEMFS